MPNNGGGDFSGNWLNFLTTSRMDVIRKVLYGGLRQVDTGSRTVLEGSMVPTDAHVWGYDVMSDERWATETPQSVYYDISKYTPYAKPSGNSGNSAHFFARTRSFNNVNFPIVRYLLNAHRGSFRNLGELTTTQGRYWDWSLNERPNPKDSLLQGTYQNLVRAFTVRVEVCKAGNISETEGCRQYPDGNFKPVGLLQKYGEGDKMYFGLMTGSYNNSTRIQGGVLRHHIDSMGNAVNSGNGTIKPNGLIWTLDKLRIVGRGDGTVTDGGNYNYANASSWGNPIGEMLYEGVRYFAGLNSPTGAFVPGSEEGINPAGQPSYYKDWSGRPSLAGSQDCAKPVIMLISDIDSDFDGDNFPANTDLKMDVLDTISPAVAATLPNFDMKKYLDRITEIELGQSDGVLDSGGQYFYSKNYSDNCAAKALTSLADVKGVCPNSPAFEGTYSVAAVAYYAHTHNFMKAGQAIDQPVGIDIYAITMASAYPELVFPVKDSNGDILRKISILPAAISDRSNDTRNRIIGFVNYFIQNWQTDKNGVPFSVTITVNFEDAVRGTDSAGGSDWDMDIIMTYKIDLVTKTAPSTQRGPAVNIQSGILKGTGTYYTFKNPDNMASRDEMIVIDPNDVQGLTVHSKKIRQATGFAMGMGYTISGTTYDGTYIDVGHNNSLNSPYNSPPNLLTPCGTSGCRHNTGEQIRSFEFSSTGSGEFLPNPMWLAAKYGGFTDRSNTGSKNGVPDPGEWQGVDGNPKTYFQATNIAELPEQLEEAFQAIAVGTSTGTATSAAVNSILGGGISIQTLYYPEYKDHRNTTRKIKWVGSVFGLFVDKWGNLREDTDGDGILTLKKGPSDSNGDYIVRFEEGPSGPVIALYYDHYGNNVVVTKHDDLDNFQQLSPVWNTSKILSSKPVSDRKVYFGLPDSSGQVTLELFETAAANILKPYMIHSNTSAMLPVPGGEDLTENLISYILGDDQDDWRPRTVTNPWGPVSDACKPELGNDPNCITWRLGDIINSKPVIVGAPAFNYDFLYGDSTYYDFKMASAQRRSMVYFGANDGMLHAVNLGFYGSLKSGQVGYKVDPGTEDLGVEMWAYIPTAVLPHLQWLADPEYNHSYYVDMKPLISDVRIDGEWKTLLIGGLRLGGRTIESDALSPYSYSEIFALDITDPEQTEPKLMWRYSTDKLGMSVGLPTVVTKDDKWYVVVASGPTLDLTDSRSPYDGYSDQEARLIVLNPKTGEEVMEVPVPVSDGRSFFNDSFLPMASVPEVTDPNAPRTPWSHHTIYYGLTISRDDTTCLDTGAVYRLDMTGDLADWKLKKLIDTERPVTGAVNSAYDRAGNLWVFFGTGRVWGTDDLRPCVSASNLSDCDENHEQYLYGIKEELDLSGAMTFADRTSGKVADVSGAKVFSCETTGSGYVTGLKVTADQDFNVVKMCGSTTIEGTPYTTLANAIISDSYVGYKRKMDTRQILNTNSIPRYEMIVTQPKIDGLSNGNSLMAFTSFEPPQGTCGDDGQSYLHLVDTFTGLPTPYMYGVFAGHYTGNSDVTDKKQVPGYIDAGRGKATEAIILKVNGQTVIRASGQDGTIYDLTVDDDIAQVSSVISWREATDIGFTLSKEVMGSDLPAPYIP